MPYFIGFLVTLLFVLALCAWLSWLVPRKVAALFPEHEVERFTEHFWGLVQFWRKTEADRMNKLNAAKADVTKPDGPAQAEPAKA